MIFIPPYLYSYANRLRIAFTLHSLCGPEVIPCSTGIIKAAGSVRSTNNRIVINQWINSGSLKPLTSLITWIIAFGGLNRCWATTAYKVRRVELLGMIKEASVEGMYSPHSLSWEVGGNGKQIFL